MPGMMNVKIESILEVCGFMAQKQPKRSHILSAYQWICVYINLGVAVLLYRETFKHFC